MEAMMVRAGSFRSRLGDVSLRQQATVAAGALALLVGLAFGAVGAGLPVPVAIVALLLAAGVLALVILSLHRTLEQLGYLSAAAAFQQADIPVDLRIRGVRELNRAVDAFAAMSDTLDASRREIEVLRQAAVRFGMIVEAADCAIVSTDARGTITSWNPAAEHLLAHRATEALGQPVERILGDEWRGVSERLALGGGSTLTSEIVRERRDGTPVVLAVSESPVYDRRQRLAGSLLMLSDVTEQRSRESLQQERQQQLARWVVQLERRNREIQSIGQLTGLLQACSEQAEAYTIVGQFARQLFPDATGDLLVINNSHDLVETAATWGQPHAESAPFMPGQCWAMRRGIRHTAVRGAPGALCQHLTGSQPGHYACVPLSAHGELLGVIHLRWEGTTEDADALDLASRFAEAVALSLSNLRLRDTLRWQSIRDPLTGLFNRRYLEASFEREVRRADRQGRSVGVVILDVDHFKQFNDANGHDDGDAMLREIGHLINATVRVDDIACRLGGEEFIVVMPEAPLDATTRRAEELLEAIAALRVEHRGRKLPPVTASFGVAVFPDHGGDVSRLIRAADEALYSAKQAGRNCVATAPLEDEEQRPLRFRKVS